ncbi:sulfite reductase [NADPH] flavoprotein component, partial [Spiromyces aspiralis]
LPEILESVAPPAELPALGEASRFVAETLVRFGQTTGRNYRTFEFLGHSDADTVVVALGNAHLKAASVVRSLESEPSTRVGLLNLRLYSPWDINSFVSSLPASVVHLIVLGEMDQELAPRTDPLYADVAVGALIGRPASGIKIAYENVYAVDGFDLMNLIRGHAGLDPLGEREEEKEKESTKAETTPTLATPAHVEDDKDSFESTVEIAKRFVFSEAYETATAAVPSKEKKYEITVRELRRLTPDHYDRNVFHIDFDTSGSGFSYEIGDALGVYGQNDAKAVDEFLDFYGVDGDAYVTSSVDGQTQTRSVRQWLVSSLDIFGRPSKKFYSKLAEYARDPTEAEKLQWLTTSEGAAEFKARVDDTVTYADLLREFRSARPSIRQLIEAIPAIKPRHYSIASSSRMHPDSVQLLVVAVEWKTSNGTVRTGQCTRYLNSLQAGDKVTVSVKPSVMKLPEDDERPIIMAGLGTGMAPFRAFIEERAVRRSEGKKVGPIVLYFGSRHRSMEYLYGEELEAYAADGLLTNLQLAFSRDQKHKIYIQHRMREDAELLSEYMLKRGGHFYLCGPTWPAGDVKDAMVHSFTEYGEVKPGDASR